ncbi:MAG: protein-disulfide reductase DsbD [Sulfuricellaceae bacterium]|nr:protein-disulfide reductase DsbD [Sulfuricellaceae bacterium]
MKRLFIALLGLLPLLACAQEGEPLEPEQAFQLTARAVDGNTVEARYRIADGYYLYRNKFKFSVQPADISLGAAQMPVAKVKQDEFFGRMEIYRHEAVIRLPLQRTKPGAQTLTLKATVQGCADAGICYPPIEQTALIQLPALASESKAPPKAAPPGGLNLLSNLSDDGFLSPEQAFALSVKAKDASTLTASFKPASGYYLYRDKIHFALADAKGISLSKAVLPAGEIKEDPSFGKLEVYHHPFEAQLILKRDSSAAAEKLKVSATYQGCSEKGVCYPPQTSTFVVDLPAAAASPALETAPASSARSAAANDGDGNESSRIASLFQGGSFWLVILSFFGFGLLLALTPCVFPMIPILSGIIVGQGKELTKTQGFLLSLAYVLGMAITYAAAGVAAGLSGTLLSNALQNPWVLGGFAGVFVALSFSMFGFYDLQLPSFLQSRFSDASNRMKGGSLAGVFVMGVFSAVIVGPCVAAPLAGALLYIGQTHNVWLGGSALFAMAMGMGVPLLLVGISAGALLPRAGGWMNAVKSFFGVLLLAVAIWLVSPVISPLANMLAWAALLIVSAIYLHAIDPLPVNASGFKKFWKGVGVITLITGVALLIGALSGSRDILQPLGGLRVAGAAAATEAAPQSFVKVSSPADLAAKLQQAQGKPVMLDFYADWCVSCKELERYTFSDAKVQAKLKDMVLLQADVTGNTPDDKALLKKFGLFGPPGIVFFDKTGQEAGRVIGYQPPEQFLNSLAQAQR